MKKNITITNDISSCPIKNVGFTLVELMVVIAIIAILTTIVLISFNGARNSSKMAKRYSDIGQIKNALEVYHNAYGKYPIHSGWISECSSWVGTSADLVIPGLVPTYLPTMPSDPEMTNPNKNCYLYNSSATGTDYKVLDYNVVSMNSSPPKALVDLARNGANTASPKPWADTTGVCSSNSWHDGSSVLAVWSSAASQCW